MFVVFLWLVKKNKSVLWACVVISKILAMALTEFPPLSTAPVILQQQLKLAEGCVLFTQAEEVLRI